jgi:hypothetical protein
VVVLILEKENLDRMREADPFDLQLRVYASGINVNRPIRELDFVIAYEEDTDLIAGFKMRNDIAGLVKWIERGRKHRIGDAVPPAPFRID